jgi:hypothetical protein
MRMTSTVPTSVETRSARADADESGFVIESGVA